MKRNFFYILALLVLTGCSTIETVEVVKTKNVVLVMPSRYVAPCPVTKPPTIDEYTTATAAKKEELLFVYSSLLLVDLGKCNTQLKSLRKWEDDQLKLYSKGNSNE